MIIYKYPLQMIDEQTINIPNLSFLLDVQTQSSEGDQPVLWACVDNDANHLCEVTIIIIGTGIEFENDFVNTSGKQYLSTFQVNGFVGHVFYELTHINK